MSVFHSVASTLMVTPSSPNKQIVINSLSLQELWRLNNIKLPIVLVTQGRVILASQGTWNDKIVVLNAQTGEVIWETSPTVERPWSLAVDDQAVYAGYTRSVQAYDLKTGKPIWTGAQQSKDKKGGLFVYPEGDRLEVNDPSSDRLLILDTHTGETITVTKLPNVFFDTGSTYYLREIHSVEEGKCCRYRLVAHSKATDDRLWSLEVKGIPLFPPILVDKVMYLEAGNIYALDADTGQVYWASDVAYSRDLGTPDAAEYSRNRSLPKIAYGSGLIYTIRNDGAIVGLEAETGQEVGIVTINPSSVRQYDNGSDRYTHYRIAASDEFMVVYYDDSEELIVFKQGGETDLDD